MEKHDSFSIDLRRRQNKKCTQKCNKDKRKELTDQDLCQKTNSVLDGLPIRCVGDWAYEKIYRLTQYFGIFSIGMKNKWNKHLNYIEICSGPGRCITRNNGEEIDGTALAILNHNSIDCIQKAIFIDYNESIVTTLNKRIKVLNKENIAYAIKGNYNNMTGLKKILSQLNRNSLNLVFIDPTDCSVPFKVIEELKKELYNIDLILNIAINTDIARNIKSALQTENFNKAKEKYIAFLGSNDYFKSSQIIKLAEYDQIDELKQAFIEEYQKNLQKIGFRFIDLKKVRHYYYLLFATAHKKGLEFWQKANKIGPYRQRTLDFDYS